MPAVESSRLPLSGVVIAKNEGDRIGRCVSSLVRPGVLPAEGKHVQATSKQAAESPW